MAERTHWWIDLSICLFVCLSACLSFYLSVSLSTYRSFYLSIYLSVYLSICLSICLSAGFKAMLFCEMPLVWKLKPEKRNFFARLPSNLANSKTQQLCQISSKSCSPSKMESWVLSWQPRTNALCDFCIPSLWSTAPATKKWGHDIQSAAPVMQKHLRKAEDLMLQTATSLRNSVRWPPNMSDSYVSCTAPSRRNASLQIVFKPPTPAMIATKPSRFAHFWQNAESTAPATTNNPWTSKSANRVHFLNIATAKSAPNPLRATTACTFSTPECPKALWHWSVLYVLTSTCTSRQNGVHFFDIPTSKSAPALGCFLHFDFQIWFAPQRPAIFDLSASQMAPHPSL